MMLNVVSKQFLQKAKNCLLILTGSVVWSITMVKSGWIYSSLGTNGSGLGFWGANGHDGIWHIALAESLSKGSLQMPTFAGFGLQNYHIGFDLLLALLHKVTGVPIINVYFQFLPILFAVLIGILSYNFILKLTGSNKSAFWSTFFVYFGGSFGWMLASGESAFWSQQAISTLINPPFALSLILILLGMITLLKLEKEFTFISFFSAALVFGLLIEIKAYSGLLVLGGLLVSGLYGYVLYKKSLYLKLFVASFILSLALYLPLNMRGSDLLVFQPFWFLESMMGFVDRVNYQKFYSAMINYKSGHNYPKAILAYGFAFLIFWVGNMGTRVLNTMAIFKWVKNIKRLELIQVFMFTVISAGIVIPMFFVQKGTPWNTIQFFYYSLFFSSLLAGFVLSTIKNKVLIAVVVLMTIPTTISTLIDVYIPNRPPAMVGKNELSALKFLSVAPDGVVLTKPFDVSESRDAETNPPRPLYLYTSTAYVSALSKHPTFLEDEINLDITGYNWQTRRKDVQNWYEEMDSEIAREFLVKNNIKYIYWIKSGQSPLDLARLGVSNIYENDLVTIYLVE